MKKRKIEVFVILLIICALLIPQFIFAGGENEAPTTVEITGDDVGPTNSNQLSDLRVRQAIAYAIDMDTVAEILFEGMVVVADARIPNGPWKAPGLEKFSYDPDKARALLKAANWDESRVLDVVYYYADQQTVDLMTAVQAYLADVGIKMTFRKLEGDVSAQYLTAPADPVNGPSAINYDLAYGAIAALALQDYYNDHAAGYTAWTPANPELTALINGVNGTADVAQLKKAFNKIQKYENDNVLSIPLYYQQMYTFESQRLNRNGGQYGNPQYNYDWDILNWTVSPNKEGVRELITNSGPIEYIYTPWKVPGLHMSSRVLFDHLISCDGALTPTGGKMAKDYKLSSDGMTLTVTLKDGLTWHDGSPVTADDIKFSVELAYRVPGTNAVIYNSFNSLKGAKTFKKGNVDHIEGLSVNGNTITFSFESLDPNILLTLSQFAILPEKYLGDIDPMKITQSPFWQNPIGSGPFKVKEIKMNNYLVMVPFENYHGGVAKIDQILCYPSDENDANIIKNAAAGRLDYAFSKNTAEVKAVMEMSNMVVTPIDIPYTRMIKINQFPKP